MGELVFTLIWALVGVSTVCSLSTIISLALVFRGLERTQVSGGQPLRHIEIENKRLLAQLEAHRAESQAKRERATLVREMKQRRQSEALSG